MTDIAQMISVTCRSCGSDLEDPDDAACLHCGTLVGASPPTETATDAGAAIPDAIRSPLSSDSLWKLAIWGGLLMSILAVGAITATLLTAFFRSGESEPATGGPVAVTMTTTASHASGIGPRTPDFDPPVSEPITLNDPAIDEVIRHHFGEEVVTFKIDGTFCGRGTGTVQAGGIIHNYSMARQSFDYVLSVDLIRAWNRSVIGHLETTVEGLAPFESAEWSVEMVSSRVSTIDCRVTEVTATPAD